MSNDIDFQSYIFDPVWGSIPITAGELEIIESPNFSRLKYIKQMGVAQMSFPGAIHNRYIHSIGVMHVADSISEMVGFGENNNGCFQESGSYIRDKYKKQIPYRKIFRVAALLHDIGHPPLSHLLEELFRKYVNIINPDEAKTEDVKNFLKAIVSDKGIYSHEEATTYLIKNEMADMIITALDANRLSKDSKIELINEISLLAKGDATESVLNTYNKILNSDIDVDKIDYIVRDSYFCGLPIKLSLDEFKDIVYICTKSGDFYIKPEGISTINSFLYARYQVIKNVHLNKNNRIAAQQAIQMIRDVFQNAIDDGKISEVQEEIYNMHVDPTYQDSSLDLTLKKFCKDPVHPPRMSDLKSSSLFSQVCEIQISEMDPVSRVFLQSIVTHPSYIIKLQDRIRKDYDNSDLIVDVRNAKPSNFEINMWDIKTNCPPVYSWSKTSIGILDDSIEELKLYIYSPDEKVSFTNKNQELLTIIKSIGLDAAKELWTGEPIKTDLIILLMKALHDATKEIFKEKENPIDDYKDFWIYTITRFQYYAIPIFIELGIPFYKNEDESVKLNNKYFQDMEFLRLSNLIQMKDQIVNVPNNGELMYINRQDFKITNYGLHYCSELLQNQVINKTYSDIYRKVKTNQEKFYVNIKEYAINERKYHELRCLSKSVGNDIENDNKNEIGNKRNTIRNNAKENGYCLITF